jgi:hypothetical protein
MTKLNYRYEEKSVAFLDGCPSIYIAKKLAPWARHYAKCEGGYYAFRTGYDYDLWRHQR